VSVKAIAKQLGSEVNTVQKWIDNQE